jgi:putative ABC transport system permease protein
VVAQYTLRLDTQLLDNGRNTTASLTATQPDFEYVRSYNVAAGRFITRDDMTRKTANVVLGAQVANDLFDSADNAVGKDVRLSFGPFSVSLTVIGVMEPRGASGSGSDDTQIYLPLTSSSEWAA